VTVYEDTANPQFAIGDALVHIRARGLTSSESTWPLWTARAAHEQDAWIPAHEESGVVVALGHGAAGLLVGDEGLRPDRRLPQWNSCLPHDPQQRVQSL
jgi:D-arabinose 1-dehydrogenase-like Zn-dependent alcohol dehydrogenase